MSARSSTALHWISRETCFSYNAIDNEGMKKPIIFSVLFFILILIKCYSLEDVGCEQKADKQLQPNTIAIGHDAPDFQVELLGRK